MTHAILNGYDPLAPICTSCAGAFGLTPKRELVPEAPYACVVCNQERPCTSISDYHPPGHAPEGPRTAADGLTPPGTGRAENARPGPTSWRLDVSEPGGA